MLKIVQNHAAQDAAAVSVLMLANAVAPSWSEPGTVLALVAGLTVLVRALIELLKLIRQPQAPQHVTSENGQNGAHTKGA